jgi:steroid delta-isomerase
MADFSFSKLMRHLDEGTLPVRSASSPTEKHMREVMEAYVANIGKDSPEFAANHLAANLAGEDPVGASGPHPHDGVETFAQVIERLLDVPFTPKKAELISPVSFSLENKAAMAFKFWAEVDGRNITIDIIDVMTFDASGKICDIRAYWGVENVTVLD